MKGINLVNKPPGGRRKLIMQKSVQGTDHIKNLKFLNTANQIKEMPKEVQ